MKNMAAFFLFEKASAWPQKTALRCMGRGLTYAELARKSCAMGGFVLSRGLAPGQRVMVAMPDSLTAFTVVLGCCLAGIVPVLVNDRLLKEDYAACAKDAEVRLVFAFPGHVSLAAAQEAGIPVVVANDDTLDDALVGFAAELSPYPSSGEDVCAIFYTSGTTGHPKGIPHTHEDCLTVARVTGRDFMGYRHDDVALCSAKIFHVLGFFISMLNTFQAGATAVIDPRKPSPENTLALIERERVTIFASSPPVFSMLFMALGDASALKTLRICISAGEALPEAVYRAWSEKLGIDVWQGYGSTEIMTYVIANRPPDIVPGTTGRVLKPYEAIILDERRCPVPDGTVGEVALRGPTVMRGYLNAPEWTARAFSGDGWLLTGDLGKRENGVYAILGRKDDMFKAGGLWVPPGRVENALLSHPAVAQCAVTGGTAGAFTLVRAHVVPAPGSKTDEELKTALRTHARERLPAFMAPEDIVFCDDLPMTASGKIQRYKLRQATDSRDGDSPWVSSSLCAKPQ